MADAAFRGCATAPPKSALGSRSNPTRRRNDGPIALAAHAHDAGWPMSEAPIRVVVADDHAVVREGTAELLVRAGIDVVGQAASGDEAVRLVTALRPDVALLDLSMPGVDGLEATRQIRRAAPETAVLALTAHEDDQYVLAALDAGVSGYLSKSARGREVIDAVRTVAGGGTVFAGNREQGFQPRARHRGLWGRRAAHGAGARRAECSRAWARQQADRRAAHNQP